MLSQENVENCHKVVLRIIKLTVFRDASGEQGRFFLWGRVVNVSIELSAHPRAPERSVSVLVNSIR